MAKLLKNIHDKNTLTRGRKNIPSKKQLQTSFDKQLNDIQAQMPVMDRLLSKIIHNPAVEGLSDFISKTLARPNALLFGSISAFIGVSGTYLVAIYYGYELSGLETLLAFIIGWFIGVLYDLLKPRSSNP
jgi:hypothetical protein